MRSTVLVLLLSGGALSASMIPGPTRNFTIDHLLYLSPVTTVTDRYAQSDDELDRDLSQEFPEFDFVVNPQHTLVGYVDPHDPYKNLIWAPPADYSWPTGSGDFNLGNSWSGDPGPHGGTGSNNPGSGDHPGSGDPPWDGDPPGGHDQTPAVPEPTALPIAGAALAAIPAIRLWKTRRR